MGSVMRRLGHIHWLWTPEVGNGWSASPSFYALWLGKTRDYLQSPLLPALEQTQAAVLTREQESFDLIFGQERPYFKAIMLIFEADAVI